MKANRRLTRKVFVPILVYFPAAPDAHQGSQWGSFCENVLRTLEYMGKRGCQLF